MLPPDPPPLAAADSLAASVVREGYEVQLVAAEPLVVDPVAIAWGVDGRLWVAEMADYPSGMDGAGKPGGRIRFLQDTDHDGTYDRSTVFLDGVRFPTGVMPWRNGVLVTAAPEIFYAEDTDGDGRGDRREVLFSGFLEGNQQLRVNGLRWGLDNWVYCASGAHHGGYGADRTIHAVKTGRSIALGSRDFRFRPDTGEIDPQSGPSQFGRNRDDWGNWFGQQNSHPLWHYVLDDHYLRRNSHAIAPDPRHQVVVPANPRVYPAKQPQKRFHSFEQSGRFTSACSGMIYRDDLLFERSAVEHAFTCEPFHNLVQHNRIIEAGSSFTAERDAAEADVDFFASKDRWCRPVMVRTGPEGGLWIVDMYRYMIEHPDWLTPEGRAELAPHYRSGDDRGRIYRVFRSGHQPPRIRDLTVLSTAELVSELDASNGPHRDLVSQMLLWRADPAAIDPLTNLVKNSAHPQVRLQALATLAGLAVVPPSLLGQALRDEHPAIRRHALLLVEPLAERFPELAAAALELVDDPDAKVRLQLACTLGEWTGPGAARALAEFAINAGQDPYLTAAVISSLHAANVGDVLRCALVDQDRRPAAAMTRRLLALAVDFHDSAALRDGLQAVVANGRDDDDLVWQFTSLAGAFDALERSDTSLDDDAILPGGDDSALGQQISSLIADARAAACDRARAEDLRVAAVRLLAREPKQAVADINDLAALLVPQTSLDTQLAVIRHLATRPASEVAKALLAGWSRARPCRAR